MYFPPEVREKLNITGSAGELKSNRAFDTTQEGIVNAYIKHQFFDKMFKSVEMVNDKDRQIAGIDIVADGKNYDLKAQASKRYINNPTDTFSLELSFLNKHQEENTGWFISDKLVTDYLCFIWIPRAVVTDDGSLLKEENIQQAEIMVVNKHQLKNYFNKQIGNDATLMAIAREMRAKGWRHRDLIPGAHFSYTDSLAEKPVNIVVHKTLLDKFSTHHGFCTSFGWINTKGNNI